MSVQEVDRDGADAMRKFREPMFRFGHPSAGENYCYDVYFEHPKEVGDYRGMRNQTYRTTICTIRSRSRMHNGVIVKQTVATGKIKWPHVVGPGVGRANARKLTLALALKQIFPLATAKQMRTYAWEAYFKARKKALTPPPTSTPESGAPAEVIDAQLVTEQKALPPAKEIVVGGVVNKEVRGRVLPFPVPVNPHTGWPHDVFFTQGSHLVH